MKNLIKFGNAKLPKTTIIFNMGSSKECSARLLGLCSCAAVCYARKPEIIYPAVYPYRVRQEEKWLSTDAETICQELGQAISKKRVKPTLFRFNESGDFHSQNCITKLSIVAEYLLKEFSIKTYGYTARKDLDFSNASFMVKGSDNDSGNHGKTIVIATKNDLPENFLVCPGSCFTCKLCSSKKAHNIAFIKH